VKRDAFSISSRSSAILMISLITVAVAYCADHRRNVAGDPCTLAKARGLCLGWQMPVTSRRCVRKLSLVMAVVYAGALGLSRIAKWFIMFGKRPSFYRLIWDSPFLFNRRLPFHCTLSAALGAKESSTTLSFLFKASQQSRIRGHPSDIFLPWTARSQQAGFIPGDGVIWIPLGDNCFLQQRIARLNTLKRPSL
jgi:hypothetical protein